MRSASARVDGPRTRRRSSLLRHRLRGRKACQGDASLKPDAVRVVFRGRRIGVSIERWGGFEREIVDHPGAVVVVAVDDDGRVALVRQFRPATRSELIELPAGTLETGEDPLETARRELQEETGLRAANWRPGPVFWTAPGFCRERMHLFYAEQVERGEPSPDPGESIELVWWPFGEIRERLQEVEDAKTLLGLLLYLDDREIGSSSSAAH